MALRQPLVLAIIAALAIAATPATAKPPDPKAAAKRFKHESSTVPEFDISSVLNGSVTTEWSDGTYGVMTWKQQKRDSPQRRRGLP